MWYNNPEKEILFLEARTFSNELSSTNDFHRICWAYNRYDIAESALLAYNKNRDFIKDIQSRVVSNIEENSKIYFYKQSKFPRFKLQETSYKRVIKQDKADYFEIPKIPNYTYFGDFYIFENDCAVFMVNKNIIDTYADGDLKIFLEKLEAIENRSNFNPEPTYIGPIYKIKKSESYIFDFVEKFPNTKIILDSKMNEIVSKAFQPITENDVNTILPMLKSSDSETIGLGLKLLANTDITATPYLAYTILNHTYCNWRYNPVKTSVSVAQMINSLNFQSFIYDREAMAACYIYNKCKALFKKEPTDEEIRLIREKFVIPKEIGFFNRFKISEEQTCPFSPKITITIE